MDYLFSVRRILREIFGDDDLEITPQTNRADIKGWDSVAQIKIMLSMEEAFAIRFGDGEIASLNTVGEFVDYIRQRKENE